MSQGPGGQVMNEDIRIDVTNDMQKDEIISNLHQESGPICTSLIWTRTVSLHADPTIRI